jgi:hypothetical protein
MFRVLSAAQLDLVADLVRAEKLATDQGNDIARRLIDRECAQLFLGGTGRSKEELCFTDSALQCAEIRWLTGAGYDHIQIVGCLGGQPLCEFIWADDMILGHDYH